MNEQNNENSVETVENVETAKTIEVPKSVTLSFTWSPSKDSPSREAEVTLDLSKVSGKGLLDYAFDSLVIKLQGQLRRKFGTENWESPKTREVLADDGKVKKIETYTVTVEEPGTRASADPTKKMAKEMAELATSKGVSLNDLKAMIAQLAAEKEKENEELERGENEPSETEESEEETTN